MIKYQKHVETNLGSRAEFVLLYVLTRKFNPSNAISSFFFIKPASFALTISQCLIVSTSSTIFFYFLGHSFFSMWLY